jgi:hypothetical protein
MIPGQEHVPGCHTLPMSVNEGIRRIGYFGFTNKYVTTRENMKEWIEIIRGRLLEKVKVDLRITTGNPRENLKRWVFLSA